MRRHAMAWLAVALCACTDEPADLDPIGPAPGPIVDPGDIDTDVPDIDVEPGDPGPISDLCDDARTPLRPGRHTGDLSALEPDIDSDCLPWGAAGPDGFGRVTVPPRTLLSVSLWLPDGDAALVLLEGCGADTCLADADLRAGSGNERVTWFNDATEPVDVVVVVDDFSGDGGAYALDVTLRRTTELPAVVADTCAAAAEGPSTPPGFYRGDLSVASPSLDTGGRAGCTPWRTSGEDLFVPVDLAAGQWLDVTLDELWGDGALYVVSDCADVSTCLVGDDGQPIERVTLSPPAPGRYYVVVDSFAEGALGPFLLDVRVR